MPGAHAVGCVRYAWRMGIEEAKFVATIVMPLMVLIGGWLFGLRISTKWAIRQKQKELNLSARNDFYRLYGEFFSVWKLWHYYKRNPEKIGSEQSGKARWELLSRACAAEAGIEALLLRLVGERMLSIEEVELLGKFRQAYHTLRERIREDQLIPWDSSDRPGYIAFKRYSCRVAELIDREPSAQPAIIAQERFIELTDNKWENNWIPNDSKAGAANAARA